MKKKETDLLKDFLYEAIFIPEGAEPPDRDIIERPELKVYYEDFGSGRADNCIVAEEDGRIVGAVWTRIMNDYGHVDDDTPSFAIALYREYRGKGTGTRMMEEMLKLLREQGFEKASLAVQKENYACRMYEKTGFVTVGENDEEYIMVCDLNKKDAGQGKTAADENNIRLFEETPILRAVVALEVPTVISQLITVAYNMADTFFIGQVGDPNQVAAASICLPLFMLLTGIANLFGIGGASLISRSLGKGDTDQAKKASAFSLWTAGTAALIYGIGIYTCREAILPKVGADSATFGYCSQYMFWVITAGAVPTVLSAAFAHLVRAEGYSRQASFGVALGGILNIVLDPIFISGFHMEIAGAAIATLLSNIAAVVYFVMLIRRKKDSLVLSLDPRNYTVRNRIPYEVMFVGLPSAIMNVSGVTSNIFMNRLMAAYCDEAIAGIGIAKKVDMLNYAAATGMSQGVIPLIGYNYSSGNYKRMMAAVKTTVIISVAIAFAGTAVLLTGAGSVVRAFINDPKTIEYGSDFQRIICVTGPLIPAAMVIITMFQSVGKKVTPLILSLLRKGGVDIPAMIVLNRLVGINGIAWATPVADFVSMAVAVICFVPFWKKLKGSISEKAQT